MKVYKKIMNGLAFVEKLVLVLSTILIVVLTVETFFPVRYCISPGHLPKSLSLRYLS